MSIRSRPESLEALVDRAPDAVRAVVEHDVAARGVRVERVVLAVASLVVEVLGARQRRGRHDEPADLRRQHELVARPSREARTHPALGGAVAVQRRDVERPDAERPGVPDEGDRVGVGDRPVEPADRRPAEPEAGGPQRRPPDGDAVERFVRHSIPRLTLVGSASVSFNQSATGQYTERERGFCG